LPGRTNVVVTRQDGYSLPADVVRVGSLDEALAAYAGRDVVINGGGTIYERAMASADALDVTHVHRDVSGDTFFPAIDPAIWREASREDHDGFSFVTYHRA
jgi:dihydrofolate reductase